MSEATTVEREEAFLLLLLLQLNRIGHDEVSLDTLHMEIFPRFELELRQSNMRICAQTDENGEYLLIQRVIDKYKKKYLLCSGLNDQKMRLIFETLTIVEQMIWSVLNGNEVKVGIESARFVMFQLDMQIKPR